MAKTTRYAKGDYNVICDYSGRKVKASECKKTWDGFFVHKDYWEPRHPQDFVRGTVDEQKVPIARPEAPDQFVEPDEVKKEDL